MPVVGKQGSWGIPRRAEAVLGIIPPVLTTFTIPIGARNVTLSFGDSAVSYRIQADIDTPSVYAFIPIGVTTVALYRGPLGRTVDVRVYASAGTPDAILEIELI